MGIDPGFAISRVIAELWDVGVTISNSMDDATSEYFSPDDNIYLSHADALALIERLTTCATVLCHIVSPDDHSFTTRMRSVRIANEMGARAEGA